MDQAPTTSARAVDEPSGWVFAFSVCSDLRFISHEDTLRLFRRALARTDLPVRFSQGFNPLPRLRIPLPRPVGIASLAERIVIEFERDIEAEPARIRLDQQTPEDMPIVSVRRLQPGEAFLSALACYRLEPDGPLMPNIEDCIQRVLEAEALPLERKRHRDKRTITIDVRPYLESLQVDDGAVLFTLRVTPQGTAKPAEIAGLLGYDSNAINHRILRTEVQWQ